MNQRSFVTIFIILTAIGIIVLAYSRLSATSNLPSGTTPPPNDNLFSEQPVATSEPPKNIKQYPKFPGELSPDEIKNKKAVLETNKGLIEFEIYPQASKAASNFIFLAKDGFYNGLTFHRVESGFVVQGGDPLGNGIGGPGYTFTEENLFYKKYDKGIVAYAKKGNEPPGTGGSQFFIMLKDTPLPPEYVIFGKVNKGMDVVEKIIVGDRMSSVVIIDSP